MNLILYSLQFSSFQMKEFTYVDNEELTFCYQLIAGNDNIISFSGSSNISKIIRIIAAVIISHLILS